MNIRRILFAVVALLVVAGLAVWLWPHGNHAGHGEAEHAETKQLWQCPMHPNVIREEPAECPICGMDLVAVDKSKLEGGPGAAAAGDTARGDSAQAGSAAPQVYIDPGVVQKIGVRTEAAARRPFEGGVRASGVLRVDEARLFAVNNRVAGWVEKLHVATTGARVRKGQPLMEIYSPELVATQEELLQARRYAASMTSSAGGAAPGGAAHGGVADLVESARRRLRNWGISASEISALESRGAVQRTVAIRSPADGVVLEKSVVEGQNAQPGQELYRIADLSRLWAVASVYQADLASVRTGAPAEVALESQPGRTFRGKVSFVSPVLDPETRTAEVRVELSNTPTLDLKPEMFAQIRLLGDASDSVLTVPSQAIIATGERRIAIVAAGGGHFEPREVTVGRSGGGYVEILSGIRAGEEIVTSAQFLIDSESNLRAALGQMLAGPHAGHGGAPAGGKPDKAPAAGSTGETPRPAAPGGHQH